MRQLVQVGGTRRTRVCAVGACVWCKSGSAHREKGCGVWCHSTEEGDKVTCTARKGQEPMARKTRTTTKVGPAASTS